MVPDTVEEIDYEGLSNASLGISMMAGGLAGISEHVAMHPVDSIKTRMQIISSTKPGDLSSNAGNEIYKSMRGTFRQVVTTEGAKRLWKGVGSVIMGAGPSHAVYFGTYETTKEFLGGNQQGQQILSNGLAGSTATIASDALMNPFDVIKQRMQAPGSPYKTAFEAARSVYRAEGARAFYISYPTTLMMTIPFTAVQFSTYEELKRVMNPSNTYSPLIHVVCGGISGALGAAVTTPLDVCKTLLQTRGVSKDPAIQRCRGMLDAMKLIYQSHGLVGFSRGIAPRILSFMPSNALCWLSYEFFRRFFIREAST
ncbi:mitochondrial solute transporter [Phakopsora pachyrhizi]|nr:mitochondrial solute transporter [Phakopsora pachyrhizi]